MAHKNFLNSIPHKFSKEEEDLLKRALQFAQQAHRGQKRKSGEDYLVHPVGTALILGRLFPDTKALSAALLHDVPEDTGTCLEDIKQQFGEEICRLVDGVTKLGQVRLRSSQDKFYIENLRKLFIATSKDIRVILIKLADRLHNMRTIQFIPPAKQLKVATETLEMYAPIAGRLGISTWKDELEELSFKIVFPEEYEKARVGLEEELKRRGTRIKETQKRLEHLLRTEGIKFLEVSGRVKRPYSFHRKLERYRGEIGKIYDIVAFRIITRATPECYAALGAIHKHFQPVPGRIKDYIATPKPNGYQSIHTTVFDQDGKTVEIQIRTDLMHEEAERGVAAHWFYEEEGKNDYTTRLQAPWIKELSSWQELTDDPEEYLENLRIDFFRDRIFVFTPRGDVKDLPLGATVIDFAFAVHSDLGYHMMGAKINGKMGSIFDELDNEDTVEVIKSKKPVKISRDWLKAAKTSNARGKIRHYLNENDKSIIQRVKELKLKDLSLPKFFRKK